MAEKFIKVNVSREMHSEVYIKIDDEDPRFAECFLKNGKFNGPFRLPPLTVDDAVRATLNKDTDWEVDDSWISTNGGKVVEKEEATQYKCWDATKKAVYQKEGE